ncbi:MAG: hypothetical protein GY918_14500, partial [Gammaproteobacteria bacterium]|nr:hypothetical protein [Gammaproteobacteria bacterium]
KSSSDSDYSSDDEEPARAETIPSETDGACAGGAEEPAVAMEEDTLVTDDDLSSLNIRKFGELITGDKLIMHQGTAT